MHIYKVSVFWCSQYSESIQTATVGEQFVEVDSLDTTYVLCNPPTIARAVQTQCCDEHSPARESLELDKRL